MSTKTVTGEVRFSYFSALSARTNEMNGKEEFSTQVLVPKSDTDTVAGLKAAAKAALMEKFGDKIPKNIRNPLRDGDTETKGDGSPMGEEYAGHWFFNTKSSKRPGAVDAEGNDILGNDEIVSGDHGRVSLNAYAYDTAGNKGVAFGLNNIMFTRRGKPLGVARSSAADDFGIVKGKSKPAADLGTAGDDDWN
ncbi:MAG: DUF2815 family protein [Gammaproteobacteria bacterium]|nr:DUF2815 family protein [Gammaproteobacteria bacterium]